MTFYDFHRISFTVVALGSKHLSIERQINIIVYSKLCLDSEELTLFTFLNLTNKSILNPATTKALREFIIPLKKVKHHLPPPTHPPSPHPIPHLPTPPPISPPHPPSLPPLLFFLQTFSPFHYGKRKNFDLSYRILH